MHFTFLTKCHIRSIMMTEVGFMIVLWVKYDAEKWHLRIFYDHNVPDVPSLLHC